MSRFSGPQGKGAQARAKARRRDEAILRDEATTDDRRRMARSEADRAQQRKLKRS